MLSPYPTKHTLLQNIHMAHHSSVWSILHTTVVYDTPYTDACSNTTHCILQNIYTHTQRERRGIVMGWEEDGQVPPKQTREQWGQIPSLQRNPHKHCGKEYRLSCRVLCVHAYVTSYRLNRRPGMHRMLCVGLRLTSLVETVKYNTTQRHNGSWKHTLTFNQRGCSTIVRPTERCTSIL